MVRTRLIAVIAAGALGLTALGGCRVEAGAAAYVGSTKVTQSQVEKVLNALVADGYNGITDKNRANARRAVMSDLVFVAVAKRYAQEKGYDAPSEDYSAASEQTRNPQTGVQIPASDPYLRTRTDAEAYRQLLLSHSTAATPTDADFREMYKNLTDQGLTLGYDQTKAQLQQVASIGPGLGLRNALDDAIKRFGVQVNPVYGSVDYPLVEISDSNGQSYPLIDLSLGGTASPAVVDAR
jgi:hypothetical protein